MKKNACGEVGLCGNIIIVVLFGVKKGKGSS